MNPLHWKRHHQVAGIAFCAVGAIAGVFFAWMDSPFRQLSSHSISGEWADAASVFLHWLSHVGLYWPWPLMGACAAALAFYGVQLTRNILSYASDDLCCLACAHAILIEHPTGFNVSAET
ncbi:MAG: hypothetical protein ACXVAM_19435 [Vulcanimicrobiaceae bacterium]